MFISGSPLLVVDVNRTGVFPADQLAFALGYDKADMAEGTNEALAALAQRRASIRYVIMDIGLHGEDYLPVIHSIVRAADPTTRVVVIGNINDLGFYRSLKNIGVYEYYTHPANIADIRAALTFHTGPSRMVAEGRQEQPGTVLAFMSAASGDGSSTIAMNVGFAIAQEFRVPTVVVDLDYQWGMLARHLDLQAQFGIRELFDYPERGVDATLVSKMLLPYGDMLKVIAAPDSLRQLPNIHPDTVRDLINVLKTQFAFIILDVPHVWTGWSAEALAQADKIVMVAQLWLRSLTHLSRLLNASQEMGIDKDKILLSVNRSGARFREAITPQDFERVCLKTINYYFANDIKTVVNAENQGKTLLEVGSSLLERQLRDAARALYGAKEAPQDDAGQQETVAAAAMDKLVGRKGLLGLFK